MRVITGSAKGRKLATLVGAETRPTSDRMKESIFNIIQFDIEGRIVLDLFCGTGQMGIEAMSRGAERAVFVDMSTQAVKTTRLNVETVGFAERSKIIGGEALQYVSTTPERFDVIFLDPPYATALMGKSLEKISKFDILREGGIIVCECGREEALPELEPPYYTDKRYDYGNKSVVVYQKRGR